MICSSSSSLLLSSLESSDTTIYEPEIRALSPSQVITNIYTSGLCPVDEDAQCICRNPKNVYRSWQSKKTICSSSVHGAPSSLRGPVDPSFRALSGRLKLTVRRHKFKKEFLPPVVYSSPIRCTSCTVKSVRSRRSFISSPLWTP